MGKCQHKDCDQEAIGETLKQVNPTAEKVLLATIATCKDHWMILHETWGLVQLQRLFEFEPERPE